MAQKKRDEFKSKFGVLLAMVGSAVGLGNLWRFPYLMGTNGGSAFIIVYLGFVIVLCLPVLFSEFIVGKASHSNACGAFKTLAPGSKWYLYGLLSVCCCFMILSFYNVVGGWTLNYLIRSFTVDFSTLDNEVLVDTFQSASGSVGWWLPLLCFWLFMLFNAGILTGGIQAGIEKFTKIMTPALFLLVAIIASYSLSLNGSMEGLRFMFAPDFSKLSLKTLQSAMGQAFLSLSIGCGCILTYASYVKDDHRIMKTSLSTALADTFFALLAGCAIMPAVFSFGISPSQGPGLVFVTLPGIFAQLPVGRLIAILFFFVLFLAALTSSISMFEVAVAYVGEEYKLKRKSSVLVCMGITVIFGSLCSLSMGPLADFHIFGKTVFDFFDSTTSNILMPLGGLIIVLFVGWRMKKSQVMAELTNGGSLKMKPWLLNAVWFLIRFVAPLILIVLLTSTIFIK